MKLTKVQQLLAGVVIIILVVVVTKFLFLKGDEQRILAAQNNISKLKQDIAVARQIEKTAAVLEEEIANLTAQLERLKKILPVSINEPKFVSDLKRFANENGLEITQFSRNSPVRDDVIIEVPYSFETRGNYHDYGRFFAKLTSYQRIVNIKALHLIGFDERRRAAALSGEYSLEGSFVISVYTYREQSMEELRRQFREEKKARARKGKR